MFDLPVAERRALRSLHPIDQNNTEIEAGLEQARRDIFDAYRCDQANDPPRMPWPDPDSYDTWTGRTALLWLRWRCVHFSQGPWGVWTRRAWRDEDGVARGTGSWSQWMLLENELARIDAELGPERDTPKRVSEWLKSRLWAIERIAREQWKANPRTTYITLEGPTTLIPWIDRDELWATYKEASERIKPFIALAQTLADLLPDPLVVHTGIRRTMTS